MTVPKLKSPLFANKFVKSFHLSANFFAKLTLVFLFFFSSWTFCWWAFRYPCVLNDLSQTTQLCLTHFSWTMLLWLKTVLLSEHWSQSQRLPSCTLSVCRFKSLLELTPSYTIHISKLCPCWRLNGDWNPAVLWFTWWIHFERSCSRWLIFWFASSPAYLDPAPLPIGETTCKTFWNIKSDIPKKLTNWFLNEMRPLLLFLEID